ncbi:MAG: 2OG-Fe(II) oxygenase [Methyloligellaceae bacterium]
MDQFTANPVVDAYLACLANAQHETWPFDFWLLEDPLPEADADALAELAIDPAANAVFDGRRETNNDVRVYVTPDMQERHAVCGRIADAFKHPRMIAAIEARTGTVLDDCRLRIEYCQDTDGFWLEPHTDILVKKFTMLIYLSDDPELRDAGTDVYDDSGQWAGTTPYDKNLGLIFIPGPNTWHGFRRRPIRGIRKSIIVNYVGPEWRDTWELA